MTTSYTNNYGLAMPEQGAGEELSTPWDAELNGNFVAIDGLIKTNADAIASAGSPSIGSIPGLTAALAAKENVANKAIDGTLAANSDTNYPSQKAVKTYADTKASASHTHAESDVTNLVSDLAGKAPLVHTHAESDVTGLVADLAAKAPIASPTFTGTPAAPTAAVNTATTQLATTEFVTNQAAALTPQPPGTAAVGTSLRYARADHVHAPGPPSLVLDTQFASNTLTGDSTDQVIFTYTLPANTMAAGKGLRITARFNQTGTTSTAFKVNFGGTAMISSNSTAAGNNHYMVIIFNQPGVTNAQSLMGKLYSVGGVISGTYTDAAVATTSNVTITITFNVANTVTITGNRMWLIELIP